MVGGGWWVAGDGWWVVGWRVGGWWVVGDWWWVVDGEWWVVGGGWWCPVVRVQHFPSGIFGQLVGVTASCLARLAERRCGPIAQNLAQREVIRIERTDDMRIRVHHVDGVALCHRAPHGTIGTVGEVVAVVIPHPTDHGRKDLVVEGAKGDATRHTYAPPHRRRELGDRVSGSWEAHDQAGRRNRGACTPYRVGGKKGFGRVFVSVFEDGLDVDEHMKRVAASTRGQRGLAVAK